MKIIVMSDSHNNYFALNKIVQDFYADLYIHLGDGERELNRIYTQYPDKKFIHIAGNCDFASLSEKELFSLLMTKTVSLLFTVINTA